MKTINEDSLNEMREEQKKKLKKGHWYCPECGFKNFNTRFKCKNCQHFKDENKSKERDKGKD